MKNSSNPLKSGSTLFLKSVLLVLGFIMLAWIIWFPTQEGRAKNLTLIQIYSDPLIIYGFAGTVPFFAGLYQAFQLLNLIDNNKAFSKEAVKRLKNIKYLSLALIVFIVLFLIYIRIFVHSDDPAGPTMLGFLAAFAVSTIATAAGVFQKLLQNAVDIKSENDLTV